MAYALLVLAAFLAEIASIFLLGSYLGAGWTILALAGSIGLGMVILAGRGVLTLTRAAEAMRARQAMAPVMIDGALVAFAGALLITPGFASDVIALGLLLPPLRHGVRDGLVKRWEQRVIVAAGGGRPAGEYIDTTGVEIQDDDAEAPPPRPGLPE